MGCRGSKDATKQPKEGALSPEAARFMSLVNDECHAVARKTLEEWSVFVDAHTRRRLHGDTSGVEALAKRSLEMWATASESEAVTHPSVDTVGQSFLQYLRNDLTLRSWGGEFDYSVAGVATQGYLRITAKIEMGALDNAPSDEHAWEIRIHYHSK